MAALNGWTYGTTTVTSNMNTAMTALRRKMNDIRSDKVLGK